MVTVFLTQASSKQLVEICELGNFIAQAPTTFDDADLLEQSSLEQ